MPKINRLFIFCFISLISCSQASVIEPGADLKDSLNVDRISVKTVPCKYGDFCYYLSANGKISAFTEQKRFAERSGVLLVCNVVNGLVAKKGQILAEFDNIEEYQKFERAELNAFNGLKEYESQLLGYQNLFNNMSDEESNIIKKKLRISSGLAAAEQDIKEVKLALGQGTLKAPFDGIIADVKVRKGERIKSGQELYTVYDGNDLRIDIKVLESDISLIKPDLPAEIIATYSPSKKFNAYVSGLNPYIDENGLVQVQLRIKNDVHKEYTHLYPGMNCNVVLKIPVTKALIIPKEALIVRNNKPIVFTYQQGRAKWNYVDIGKDNGSEVEIKGGLKAGQKVIITNNLQLADDALVLEDSSRN